MSARVSSASVLWIPISRRIHRQSSTTYFRFLCSCCVLFRSWNCVCLFVVFCFLSCTTANFEQFFLECRFLKTIPQIRISENQQFLAFPENICYCFFLCYFIFYCEFSKPELWLSHCFNLCWEVARPDAGHKHSLILNFKVTITANTGQNTPSLSLEKGHNTAESARQRKAHEQLLN